MDEKNPKENDRKIPYYLSLGFSIFGLSALLINIFLVQGHALGFVSMPAGMVAFVLAYEARSVKLALLGLSIIPGFFLYWYLVQTQNAAITSILMTIRSLFTH